MLKGQSTWLFDQQPTIIATGTVGGPFEANGKIPEAFDKFYEDLWIKQKSFEHAQQIMMEESCQIALNKANIQKEDINLFLSGDLINQITPSTFTAKTLGSPYLGLFSACATSSESLALGAFLMNNGGADYILCGSSSHNAAAERQYRYPTEYGGQKPPTAQWTATGAGTALLASDGEGPVITSATIGKVIDMGMTDPFNMGGAMAPAAADTIMRHLQSRQIDADYYDLIVTGDLGRIGREASFDHLKKQGIMLDASKYMDCGLVLYKDDQPVNAGGSGSACSAIVTFGHFLHKIKEGKLKRILMVATGSLHSPLTVQQKGTIPTIAHAVSIEARRN